MDNSCKFRYWDNRFKRWVVGKTVYLSNDGMAFLDVDPHGVDISGQVRIYPVDSLEIVWSTGLCDSEGVDVFEGDILITSNPNGITYDNWNEDEFGYTVVCWDEKNTQFKGSNWMWEVDGDENIYCLKFVKIIGNRFENPELLEE